MENVENRNNIKLVTHWDNIRRSRGARSLIAQPNFKSASIFHEDFVAIHMGTTKISYFKPIYIGFSVLELSKTIMYDFFYDVIKQKFKEHASLLYMDTDSLILKVETDDFYTFIRENVEKFDTSNYEMNNRFQIPITKSVLGKMKDEYPADPIVCFYGTGAKAYYVQTVESMKKGKDGVKRAKGVKKAVVNQTMSMIDYKNIVENGGTILREMNTFRSHHHDIYTEMVKKIALSHRDDKRFIIPNTARTLPWGHSDIPFYETDPTVNNEILLDIVTSLNCDEDVQFIRGELSPNENDRLDIFITMLMEELEKK